MLIAKHFHTQQPAWSAEALAEHMATSVEVCNLLINRLVKAGLLVETAGSPGTFLPARDLDTLTLNDIVSSVRTSEEGVFLSFDTISMQPEIRNIHSEIEAAIAATLKGKTLRDLSCNSNE
jgi:membrane protein